MNGDNLLSRRSALCGIMAAVAVPAGLVTACSSSGSSGTGSTPTSQPASTTPTGQASGGALVALADVPEGGGVVVDQGGKKIIVARVSATEVKAYDATCTHQGATVGAPANGVMTCPAHGSQFTAADGAVQRGPAAASLRAIAVKIDGAQVVLA